MENLDVYTFEILSKESNSVLCSQNCPKELVLDLFCTWYPLLPMYKLLVKNPDGTLRLTL
jgi:hypothetical protein